MPPIAAPRVLGQFDRLLLAKRRWSARVFCRSYKITHPIFANRFSKHTRERMATQIRFGTSGWRAVMAEEFTFANVQRAVHGIARYVSSQTSNGAEVIVGRDPRFLGETFCAMAADVLSNYGITPLVIAEATPTPTISYAVIQSKADGAIN